MAVVVEIIHEVIKPQEEFYNCKKCNSKGVFNKNKILCDKCLKDQKEKFENGIKKK